MTRLNVKTIQSLTPHLYSTPVIIVRLKSQKTIALCCFQMAWMKTGDEMETRIGGAKLGAKLGALAGALCSNQRLA